MSKLEEAIENLIPKIQSKPAAWCRSLVNGGQKQALLLIDNSTRAALGTDVERQLRVVKIMCDQELLEADRPQHLKENPWPHTAEVINAGVMSLLDLLSVSGNNDTSLNFPKTEEVVSMLEKQCINLCQEVCGQLEIAKQEIAVVEKKVSVVMKDIESAEWINSAELKSAVHDFNQNPDQLKNGIAGDSAVQLAASKIIYTQNVWTG